MIVLGAQIETRTQLSTLYRVLVCSANGISYPCHGLRIRRDVYSQS